MSAPQGIAEAVSPQLNAPAVSVASVVTGIATYLNFVPPVAGAISSIIGVFLAAYLVRHRMVQLKTDKHNERKAKADADMAELELQRMKEEEL